MKPSNHPNGLTRTTINCLTKAGIPIDKKVIVEALKSGKLYPFFWPPNYGSITHRQVCKWAGVDADISSAPTFDGEIFPNIGLSFRAWNTLKRSGIPVSKKSVRHAIKTGLLSPGKRPGNYGKVTHAELCRWVKTTSG